MPNDTPRADDDLATAEEKSGTIDQRVPDVHRTASIDEPYVVGAPAALMPPTVLGAAALDDLGPGEAVLEQEAKAQKSKVQRG